MIGEQTAECWQEHTTIRKVAPHVLYEDFLDRYVVSPGDDPPDDYTWAR